VFPTTSFAPTESKVDSTWIVFLCVLLGGAAFAWLVFSYGYVEDDAFIHLEFARSLADGRGFSFNGQLVGGDTAPLWVVLLAAIHSIGIGWIAAAKVACGAGVVVSLTGVWRVAADISGIQPRKAYLAPAAVLLTAVNPYFVHWSFSGMEAVTALGVSLWAIWAVFSPSPLSFRRLALGAALLSMAPLLRPELLLLSSVAGSVLLYRAWRLAAPSGKGIFAIVLLAGIMALPTILWSAYAFESFGSIMPNTNAAKRGGTFVAVAAKLASVYIVGFAGTLAVAPFVAKRLLRPAVPIAIWALLLWPAICAVFYLADHTAVQTRYCLLSMPSLTIAVLWLLEESARPFWAWGIATVMAIIGLGTVAAIVFPHVSNKVELVNTVSSAVAFIREKLPADAPIAVYGIGQVAFESRHPIIDIGGITRPGVLPYLGDAAATLRWAKSQGAKYYIGGELPEAGAVRLFSYRMPFLGWTFRHSSYGTAGETGIYRLP
jgi:hypothetical protein